MNLQSVIVVVLRLMALNFLLKAAIQLSPQLLRFTETYRQGGLADMGDYSVIPVAMIIGLIMGAILIWVSALFIARLVTHGVSRDLTFGSLSLVDCYSVAFIGTGLFYIASHFPHALNWAHFLFTSKATHSGDSWKEGFSGYDVSQVFVPFIAGIFLFVNGRTWAVALARKHEKSNLKNQAVEPAASVGGGSSSASLEKTEPRMDANGRE